MKVLLLSKYSRTGASSRLRTFQYIPILQANGISVTASSLFDDQYLQTLYTANKRARLRIIGLYFRQLFFLLRHLPGHDLLWLEKELFPYMPAWVERVLQLIGKPYVVDYDDAIFHNYDLSGNSLVRRVLGRKIDVVMRNATCVIAGNAYLAERARSAGAAKVVVVPTVVDADHYAAGSRPPDGRPVIGWIGSPSTQKYLVLVRDALAKVCAARGARLMLIGASPAVLDNLQGIDVQLVPWTEDSEVAQMHRMDIGIMPLPDSPWERGKCGYKLVQYMACGLPTVGSAVGVNSEIVQHGRTGFLATTDEEWVDSLDALVSEGALRSRMGQEGRLRVEASYCMQQTGPAMVQILRSAATG